MVLFSLISAPYAVICRMTSIISDYQTGYVLHNIASFWRLFPESSRLKSTLTVNQQRAASIKGLPFQLLLHT
ncbi:hypothetical protein AV903_20915 [Erwinia tracheiphila]|uniref:Uncharacterized protein n=1 Tax=Erwinia tracheiphila TaxID=65700 RepID=A0A345CWV6_9GAMM|nr:hypothetical protein AV903_20915 [Erwinia tracheiphila]